MSVVIPKADIYVEQKPYNGAASFASGLFDISKYSTFWLQLTWGADASATDSMAIRFFLDPDSGVALPAGTTAGANVVLAADFSAALAAGAFTVPTAAGTWWAKFVNPPPFIEFAYTRAGGSRQFQASYFGRST